MSESPVPRARTAADPRVIELVQGRVLPELETLIYRVADEHAGELGVDRDALTAALCVLLESGYLTDWIARQAAMRHEVTRVEAGASAQDAHRELGDILGMTRQGIESRLSLVGSKPARRGMPSAEELREAERKRRAATQRPDPWATSASD